MKTVGAIFSLISFLLVALSAWGVAGQTLSVRDVSKNPLRPNTRYYIKVMGLAPGVWLSRYRVGFGGAFRPCPENLVVSGSPDVVPRVAVTFVSSSSLILQSAKINVKFTSSNHCEESGFWSVAESDSEIEIGREIFLNGSRTSNDSIFTIERHGANYKFVSKPDHSTDLGYYMREDNILRIILSPLNPMGVAFVPV